MIIKVLDQGYIQVMDVMGSDERIIEAARMSTNKGFEGWERCPTCKVILPHPMRHTNGPGVFCENTNPVLEPHDLRLLKHLWVNKHYTPFEMCDLVIEVKAPIMVFREWHRHRTQSFNEMSGRYVPLPDEDYLPSAERVFTGLQAAGTNKQAQGATTRIPTPQEIEIWRADLAHAYQLIQRTYESGLQLGIPKELARLPVSVARYSRMRAKANLRNWLHFLSLRLDSKAQWEIRQYALAVGQIVEKHFPRTWKLFTEAK